MTTPRELEAGWDAHVAKRRVAHVLMLTRDDLDTIARHSHHPWAAAMSPSAFNSLDLSEGHNPLMFEDIDRLAEAFDEDYDGRTGFTGLADDDPLWPKLENVWNLAL